MIPVQNLLRMLAEVYQLLRLFGELQVVGLTPVDDVAEKELIFLRTSSGDAKTTSIAM